MRKYYCLCKESFFFSSTEFPAPCTTCGICGTKLQEDVDLWEDPKWEYSDPHKWVWKVHPVNGKSYKECSECGLAIGEKDEYFYPIPCL